ncbi:tetratricopeptide repeat protein, partial [Polaribacter septentrionalilitoris]
MPEFTLDQLLEQAVEHHLSGHLQKAEPLYRAILEAQPDHAEANHHLGLLLAATGQAAEALPWLKAALESNLAQPHYWLSYATGLYQAGRPEAAQALLTLGQKNGLSASDV